LAGAARRRPCRMVDGDRRSSNHRVYRPFPSRACGGRGSAFFHRPGLHTEIDVGCGKPDGQSMTSDAHLVTRLALPPLHELGGDLLGVTFLRRIITIGLPFAAMACYALFAWLQ